MSRSAAGTTAITTAPGTAIAAPDTALIARWALQMASHQLCIVEDSEIIQGLLALRPNKAQTYMKQCKSTLTKTP